MPRSNIVPAVKALLSARLTPAQWPLHQLEVAPLNREDGQFERSKVGCSNWQLAHQNLCSRPQHGIIPVSRSPFTVSLSQPRVDPSRAAANYACRWCAVVAPCFDRTARDFGKASAKAPTLPPPTAADARRTAR
jgi:hypothetical protein